jgi:APA family basic amino acid/polyamine antiporter
MAAHQPDFTGTHEFKPTLGLMTTVSIVVGAVIGSGIFKKPAIMAQQLGSPELLLGIWILAGILTLFGALTNAEVAGMISATGGQYVYFRKMYGDFTAYLYGWSMLSVVQTASIASITYVFSDSVHSLLPLPHLSPQAEAYSFTIPFIGMITPLKDFGVKALTVIIILLLSAVNYRGVAFGGGIQVIFTALKVMALVIIVAMAFAAGNGSLANFTADAVLKDGTSAVPQGLDLAGAVVMALSGAFWAFDGWNNITYIAGEVKEPRTTIPRSLFIGMMIIIGCYMLINMAYIYMMPVGEMASSQLVAVDVARRIFQSFSPALASLATGFIAVAIMISTFGTSNGTILASARVYYAMARQGIFFPSMGSIHPRYGTPAPALAVQAVWSCLLVFSGTFDTLTDMLIFVTWVFYALGAAGVFILRRTMPDAPRPYKVWGYPYVPAIFVLFATGFVFYTVYNDIMMYMAGTTPVINSVFGIVLVAIGIPFYLYFRSRPHKEN